MKLIMGLDDHQLERVPRVLAMGAYDGVHRGHQTLLDVLCEAAVTEGLVSTAMTFEPIPLEVFGLEETPRVRLTVQEEKLELLERQCLSTIIVARFDERFHNITARDFARDILVGKLNTKLLVASETHTFGRGGEADVAVMRQLGRELGFDVRVLPLLSADGGHISSSEIRSQLWQGHVERATRLLGRPYMLRGTVVSGRAVGRQLGFPTANLELPPCKLIPANGVYAAIAAWDGQEAAPVAAGGVRGVPAAVNVGNAPTFGSLPLLVEAFVLDDAPSLVGRRMELHLIARIRGEAEFASPEALKTQIASDVCAVRAALRIDN